ncbi:hypothetical protein KTJ87_11645 [Rhodobacteraceae bacterium ASV31]|nr:hypothetical protein [Anianabacter salinae]
MSFSDAVAQLGTPIRLWVLWLSIMMIAAPVLLAIWRETRRIAVITGCATVLIIAGMQVLYSAVGMVRLLGIVHVVIWGPLFVWLALRLRRGGIRPAPRSVLLLFLATIGVSLVFDIADVLRWIAGERAPMVPAA